MTKPDLKENKKALKAGTWYLICNILLKGIAFLTAPIFNRLLSQTEIGAYSNLVSWASMLSIVFTLELSSSINNARLDFKDKELDQYMSSIAFVGTLITLIFFIIFIVFSDFFVSILLVEKKYIFVFLIYLMFYPAVSIFLAKQQAFLNYKHTIILTIVQTLSTIAVSLILILTMPNRLDGRVFGTYFPAMIMGVGLYAYIAVKGKALKWRYVKYALNICLPLVLHSLAGAILSSSDRIMITRICGEDINALYSVAYLFATISSLVWVSVNSAFSPWCYNRFDKEEFKKVNAPAIILFGAFGLMLFMMALLAPEGLLILGGETYKVAAQTVAPLLCGVLANAVYTFYVNIEHFYKKYIYVAIGTIFASLVNIGLNIWLIPIYGYVAAAYTTLIGFVLLYIFHFSISKFILKKKIYKDLMLFIFFVSFSLLIMSTIFMLNLLWLRMSILATVLLLLITLLMLNRKKIKDMLKHEKD